MIPRHGFVVRETVDDTFAVQDVNLLGVILNRVAVYRKEDSANRVAEALNAEREFEA